MVGISVALFKTIPKLAFANALRPVSRSEVTPIRAHSIQNSQVIDLLQTNGHVIALRLNFSAAGPEISFDSVGRNYASTFTGLCEKHDAELFELINQKSAGHPETANSSFCWRTVP